jgi:shikimate kinase
MGSGKSTFLKKMTPNKLGFDCIDLDHALANDLGIHPDRLGEWILANGFPLFRDKERTKIKKLLNYPESMVIAMGGGTLTPEILAVINNYLDCKIVFLDTPLEICLERTAKDPNRPLSKIPESELIALYEERKKQFLQADLVLSPTEIKEIEGLEALVHNLQ